MALYNPHSIFHLARLLYVRPETLGPYYVLHFTANDQKRIPALFLQYRKQTAWPSFPKYFDDLQKVNQKITKMKMI